MATTQGNEDVSRATLQGMDTAMQAWGNWSKTWQTLTAEFNDYARRSFEDSTTTFEKLVSSRSIEQAAEIQTDYAKRAYDDCVKQMTRLTSMYTGLAQSIYKPGDSSTGGSH